jgi:hypothetical protein
LVGWVTTKKGGIYRVARNIIDKHIDGGGWWRLWVVGNFVVFVLVMKNKSCKEMSCMCWN